MKAIILFLLISGTALADGQELPSDVSFEQHGKLLGRDLGVSHQSAGLPSQHGVQSATQVRYLGHSKTLMDTSLEAIPPAVPSPEANSDLMAAGGAGATAPGTSTPDTTGTVLATTNWYVGGTRIWSGNLKYQGGSLIYTGGISPTQIPFPLFTYPLGPLVLQVDAGVEFEGTLSASMTPTLSFPIEYTMLTGKLTSKLSAAGYVDGYAKLLVVRGGMGGRVQVIDGSTAVAASIYFNGHKPTLTGSGKVHVLSGDVYAFVDTDVFLGKWKRILKKDLYRWNGKCFAFGSDVCVKP